MLLSRKSRYFAPYAAILWRAWVGGGRGEGRGSSCLRLLENGQKQGGLFRDASIVDPLLSCYWGETGNLATMRLIRNILYSYQRYIFLPPIVLAITIGRILWQGVVGFIAPPRKTRSGPRAGTRTGIGRSRNDAERIQVSRNIKCPGKFFPRTAHPVEIEFLEEFSTGNSL